MTGGGAYRELAFATIDEIKKGDDVTCLTRAKMGLELGLRVSRGKES